jgi:hypothetical protein
MNTDEEIHPTASFSEKLVQNMEARMTPPEKRWE